MVKAAEKLVKVAEKLVKAAEKLVKAAEKLVKAAEKLVKAAEKLVKAAEKLVKTALSPNSIQHVLNFCLSWKKVHFWFLSIIPLVGYWNCFQLYGNIGSCKRQRLYL